MNTFAQVVGYALLGIVAIVVIGLLFSLPIMWLWNGCLVAAIPGVQQIGWLQAWGLNVLFGMLFKGNTTTKS